MKNRTQIQKLIGLMTAAALAVQLSCPAMAGETELPLEVTETAAQTGMEQAAEAASAKNAAGEAVAEEADRAEAAAAEADKEEAAAQADSEKAAATEAEAKDASENKTQAEEDGLRGQGVTVREQTQTETEPSRQEEEPDQEASLREAADTEDTEADSDNAQDGENDEKGKTAKEAEEGDGTLRVMTSDGQSCAITPLESPDTLTSGGVTHPLVTAGGIFKVTVPEDTRTLKLAVNRKADHVFFSCWGGYLLENGGVWELYPGFAQQKTPVYGSVALRALLGAEEGLLSVTEPQNGSYTLSLDKFLIDPEELTAEQEAVYGELDAKKRYAEIHVGVFAGKEDYTGDGLLLVEFSDAGDKDGEAAEPAQSGDEKWQEAESADIIRLSAADGTVDAAYAAAGSHLAELAVKSIPQPGPVNGEWHILGLTRSGQQVDASVYSRYLDNVLGYVQEKQGVLHKVKYTEYDRMILGLTALGEDVTDVGGYNLLQPLADFDQTVWQGLNGVTWALIAFDSHDYEIPTVEAGKTQTTRQKLIDHILSQEFPQGGWAFSGAEADADMTGMTIQSLAPYYSKNEKVKTAVDRALAVLSDIQEADGGYGTWGSSTSESCAQVLVALTSVGIDPQKDARFIKNGNSVVDALLAYALPSGGFRHVMNGGEDQMATEQAYYALTAYERFKKGQTRLYDMTDVALKGNAQKTPQAEPDKSRDDSGAKQDGKNGNTKSEDTTNEKTKNGNITGGNTKAGNTKSGTVKPGGKTKSVNLTMTKRTAGGTKSGSQSSAAGTVDSRKKGAEADPKTADGKKKGTEADPKTADGKKKGAEADPKTADGEKNGAETDQKIADGEKKGTEASDKTETDLTKKKVAGAGTGNDSHLPSEVRALQKEITSLEKETDAGEKREEQILETYRRIEVLEEEDRQVLEGLKEYQSFEEIRAAFGVQNHRDEGTDTDMLENEEEVLPWYVRLVVTQKPAGEAVTEKVTEALGERYQLLRFQDISFVNLLDGSEWHPEEAVRVKLPKTELAKGEHALILHVRENGSVEFLEGRVSGNYLEFDTEDFSAYGLVRFQGTLDELLSDDGQEPEGLQRWILCGGTAGAALLLLVLARLLLLLRRRVRRA